MNLHLIISTSHYSHHLPSRITTPPAIDNITTTSDRARLVARQKHHHLRHLHWLQIPLQTLRRHHFRPVLISQHLLDLPLRGNRPRHHTIDPNPPGPKLLAMSPRQPHDSRLDGRISRQPHGRDPPRDAAHVDDAATAGGSHRGNERLRQEEHVAQVDVHVEVPALRRHGHCVSAREGAGCGGVVDQDMDCRVGFEDLLGEILQIWQVGYIALVEDWCRYWVAGYWVGEGLDSGDQAFC